MDWKELKARMKQINHSVDNILHKIFYPKDKDEIRIKQPRAKEDKFIDSGDHRMHDWKNGFERKWSNEDGSPESYKWR